MISEEIQFNCQKKPTNKTFLQIFKSEDTGKMQYWFYFPVCENQTHHA